MVITIDGPAASGKGTLAQRLAAHFSLPHLDTGLLYRAVGEKVLAAGRPLDDVAAAVAAARSVEIEELDRDRLMKKGLGEAASRVAAMPDVRAALLGLQRSFAERPGGAVLDGRDTGTVVCPNADAKLFVMATTEARAARRYKELTARGEKTTYDEVLTDIRRRDERDAARAVAPLKPAPDAVLLDTTDLDIEAAFQEALKIVRGV
ncbi:MAG TPA: (d)CMP kinase [Xanthobacteraceae bacterium]|jgi:cytidylate kinase